MALTVVKTTALSGTITNAQLAGSIDLTSKVTGTLPAGNGGTGATSYSPGKVLQVQSFDTTTSISTTSTSFAATILTDQITPSATSSKILITVNGGRSSYGSGACEGVQSLYVSVGGAAYSEVVSMMESHVNGGSDGYGKPAASFNYLHSPNTTSALDYKVYFKTNANQYYLNSGNARLTMTLMEIGA